MTKQTTGNAHGGAAFASHDMHSQSQREARRWLPHSSGNLPRGRFIGHTHTIREDGEGSPPPSEAPWEGQDGAPAAHAVADHLGPDQRRSPDNRPARGGGTTPPAQQGGSISPTKPTQRPRPRARPSRASALLGALAPVALGDNNRHRDQEELARAVRLSLSSFGGTGRRLEAASCTSAAPPLGLGPDDASATALCRELLRKPPVAIPEEEGETPSPPL